MLFNLNVQTYKHGFQSNIFSMYTWIQNTGGPRYSRTFYPRFRLFEVQENIPKFTIRGLSLAHSRFIKEIRLKNDVKITFSSIQCSLVIRGFIICGNLMERIYRELRGKPVASLSSNLSLRVRQSFSRRED